MQNKTDLLLLYPTFKNETFYHLRFGWHLGASYVISYLRQEGISARQFIQDQPVDMDSLAAEILAHSPMIVGFTCYDVNYFFVKLIARELKKRRKDILIVTGGPTPTFSDELILRDSRDIDICVRGEGEIAAKEIIDRLKNKLYISDIAGVTYRENGRIVRRPDRLLLKGPERFKELDIMPSPYLSRVLPPEAGCGILTSRGCIYNCIYCNFSAMSRWTIRYHSVDRVVDEARLIYDRWAHSSQEPPIVSFHDDAFSLDPKRAKEICRRIIKEKILLRFWCETRPDCVDDELLGLMKEANFKIIALGLESAVPENLKTVKKVACGQPEKKDLVREKGFISKTIDMTGESRALGINFTFSVIIGLPGQTKEQAEKTIDFVEEHRPIFYHHDFLTIYPGTPLFNRRRDFGLDIIRPETVLPYRTKFLFDVSKVRVLPYALQKYSIHEAVTNIAIDLLTRRRVLCPDSTGIPAVVLSDDSGARALFNSKDIKKKLALSPVLFFLKSKPAISREILKGLIRDSYPVINVLSLKGLGARKDNPKTYELFFETEVIERRRLSSQRLALFIFMPVSHLFERQALKGVGNIDRKVVFLTVNTRRDAQCFIRLLDEPARLKDFLMRNSGFDCVILNQCQWDTRPCPEPEDKTVFIGKKGEKMFCHKGEGEFASGEKERSCRSCSAARSCSRCSRISPFSGDEFCNIMRNHAGGIDIIKGILRNYNKLNYFSRNRDFLKGYL